MDRKTADQMFADFREGRLGRRAFVTRLLALGATATSVAALLEACGTPETPAPAPAPAPAPVATEPVPPPAPAEPELGEMENELRVGNWSDYIAEDTVANFEKETGIKVSYDTYESNEELMSKLQLGAGGYDIVVPTGYIVTVLAAQNLLQPLSKKYLTNIANVAPLFADPKYDPGMKYAVPYQWGTTGIAYRSDKVPAPPDSWAVFHDPQFKRKMTMMDDMRDVLGSWLKFRGKSLNSTDKAELEAAKADAMTSKPLLKAYISAPVKGRLVAGDVWIAQLWNGDTTQAAAENDKIKYALPKEGAGIWTDSLVIPASAPHKRAAHAFVDYLLRPDVAASVSNFTGYGSPNAKGAELMESKIAYPTDEELKRLEYQTDLGAATELWDTIWTEIKAG
ncbi:MAG: spermidine/putrescine ABC transporter substrate-binding protein [Deltaproteobacteria bacterium]|nr:spermidine/putrescine ABC transporter substrate-binding protein [Deltaproteobacteria bacterium]